MKPEYFQNKRGARLDKNHIKVCQRYNGQFVITFPAHLARRIGLVKGDIINFEWVGNITKDEHWIEGCILMFKNGGLDNECRTNNTKEQGRGNEDIYRSL